MRYPGLVKELTLNHPSLEGRDVNGIEITQNPAARDGKPIFLQLGVHHAREWPSSEHAIEFAPAVDGAAADPRFLRVALANDGLQIGKQHIARQR